MTRANRAVLTLIFLPALVFGVALAMKGLYGYAAVIFVPFALLVLSAFIVKRAPRE